MTHTYQSRIAGYLYSARRRWLYASTAIKEQLSRNSAVGLPIPPPSMRDKVRKGQLARSAFLAEGSQVFDALSTVLTQANVALTAERSVYEFGCGCARVGRHFLERDIDYFGTDVDDELIEWCQAHISQDRFQVNNYAPPLPFCDERFDVSFAISVFTHIPISHHIAWISELSRVTRSGGTVIISFLEGNDEYSRERSDHGIRRDWLGKGLAPNVYLDTYLSRRHICENWISGHEIVAFHEKIIRNTQSVVVMRKRP